MELVASTDEGEALDAVLEYVRKRASLAPRIARLETRAAILELLVERLGAEQAKG